MLIKRKSIISGVTREQDIPVTQDQLDAWEKGALIQNAMPNLTNDQREFLMTGTTPEEWDKTFPDDEDEFFNQPEN